MQFNSYIFILAFLPLTVFLYFLANRLFLRTSSGSIRAERRTMIPGKLVILLAGIIFYAYSDWSLMIVMGISLAVNYLFAFCIRKASASSKRQWFCKLLLSVPVIINVAILLYFKYLDFAITNLNTIFDKGIPLKELVLPVGISFFTFQQIAYVVSSYRGEIKDTGLLDYLVYILYFPKILMGPLMEPADFLEQVNDVARKSVNLENIASGLQLFSLGLFKKVMIADIFAGAVKWGYSFYDEATAMDWMLIMLFYTFEIYFDFSGYSDMATGASLLLNIELPINFDSPYKAVSVRDFWKRWHISLTRFFTKYIYIPLGGNRKGMVFACINTVIVFFVSGLWHGANWTFVMWGGAYGLLCVLERLFDKYLNHIFEPARWLCTFGIVNVLWLLFRSHNISQWIDILFTMLCMQNLNVSDGLIEKFKMPEEDIIADLLHLSWSVENIRGLWVLVYIVVAFGICLFFENNYQKRKSHSFVMMAISSVAFVWGLMCLSSESVFVYFNF